MRELTRDIEKLVLEEVERASKRHSEYASSHEEYAVLKEEIEECKDELDDVLNSLDEMWEAVRLDLDITEVADFIKEKAILCSAEAVQIACVATRINGGKNE